MKKIKSTLLCQIAFLSILSMVMSCAHDKLPEPPECDTAITYNTSIKIIIDNSCAFTGCHVSGGTGIGNFSTYAGILPRLENGQIEDQVIVQREMPLDPGELSDEDLELLKCWIRNGFPE